jgi:hypothetical protein
MRWCNGPCGRELPVTSFPIDGHGRPWWRCRLCHNLRRRQLWKRPKVRRRLNAAHHDWYVRHAADVRAREQQRYWAKRDEICRKKRERYQARKTQQKAA